MLELQLSRSAISAAYTVGTLLGAAAQSFIGRAVDHFGGRISISVCSIAYALSLVSISLPQSWLALSLAFAAMRALGFGGLQLACTTCLQQWFIRRRGLATGCAEAVTSLAGFGFCAIFFSWLVHSEGWRRAYMLVGLGVLAYAPFAAVLLRSRPEDVGLLPDGDQPAARRPDGESNRVATVDGWTLRDSRRTAAFWLLMIANATQWGIGAGVFFHLTSILAERRVAEAHIAVYFYLPWACSRALTMVVAGWALDHIHPRLGLASSFLGSAVAFASFGWPEAELTPAMTVVLAAVLGTSLGLGSATFKITPAKVRMLATATAAACRRPS
jgi:MFS family permease